MSDQLTMLMYERSSLTDVSALLGSYGVELKRNGLVLLRQPLFFCACSALEGDIPKPVSPCRWGMPIIDVSLSLSLIRYEPVPDPDDLAQFGFAHRWPFFVEQPLSLTLQFDAQWWLFNFVPGESYTERALG